MHIFGAGMAGLLAANMLRRLSPVVCELQPSLPNNHNALLRFRTDAVSRATGIPFKKVSVQKAVKYHDQISTNPNLRLSNLYSFKVTGNHMNRSILNLEPAERYIAPPDFISQMAKSVEIDYNNSLNKNHIEMGNNRESTIISTIPMPVLMDAVKWDQRPAFQYRTIHTLSADIESPNVDLYQTIYYPGAEMWYRASITGRHLQVEMADSFYTELLEKAGISAWAETAAAVLQDFGIQAIGFSHLNLSCQKYGKIVPIDSKQRKSFIMAMTDVHNIYSLGRFATWRQILMDDVVEDVKFIESCISDRDAYKQRIQNVNR